MEQAINVVGNKERIISELSDIYDDRLFELKEYKENRTQEQLNKKKDLI